jgi:DNA-binding LacI/PurR family transcriptional regulator
MAVTIRDVAKQLHVSITTVSRALDGYDDVAEATRARVIRASREMGYVPSRAARELRRKRAEAIGFILPTSQPRFADPFFAEFIAGLGDEAATRHFDLLVSSAPPNHVTERTAYERWVQSRRVDGIVLTWMRRNDWRVRHLAKEHFPFVAFGHPRGAIEVPSIGVDGAAGMRSLVAHLVERGHQRIAFVAASPDLGFQAERYRGYRDGLAAANIALDESFTAEGDLTRTGGYQAGKRLLALPNRPTAIIGVNDLTAIGVMRAASEIGLRVGSELAVAGFDGIEDTAHTDPPLTTLNQPVYDIARQAVGMLLKIIEGEALSEPHVLLQPELIIRQSTAG